MAAHADAKYKFYAATSEWQNYLGLNEKWFRGNGGTWDYIKPNGDIYLSNATGTSVGTLLAHVDAGFYSNLGKLLDADSGTTAAQLDRQFQLYSTGNLYQNSGYRNEKWVMSQSENRWFFITPDGTLYRQTQSGYAVGDVVGSVDASYWNDINKLVSASTLFSDNDYIYGYGDNDALLGGSDVDVLSGGLGNDYIYGGVGNDTLYGNEQKDTMFGDDGNDTLMGGDDNDDMFGGDGNDTIRGEAGNDTIWGGDDRNQVVYVNDIDTLYGDAGNDQIHGGGGAYDYLYGGDNDDMLWGDDGIDYLYGGNGNDSLYGGKGIDWMYGEAGNDGLFGGINGDGADNLYGGTGADRFLTDTYDMPKDQDSSDARLYFLYGDKYWTDDEIILADKGFAWLQQTTNNTTLLKQANNGIQAFYRVSKLGDNLGGDNDSAGTIHITDFGVTSGLDEVIVHEMGHNWDEPTGSPNFRALSGWTYYNLSAAPVPAGYSQATNIGVPQGTWVNGQYYCWIYQSSTKFARDYGRTSPDEDFATSLEMYYALTKGTGNNAAANWQAKWTFIDGWLKGKKS